MRTSARPRTLAIRPAATEARRTTAPRSRTSIAVTFSAARPERQTERVRNVPENTLT